MKEADDAIWQAVRRRLDAVSREIVVPRDIGEVITAPGQVNSVAAVRARMPLSLATVGAAIVLLAVGVAVLRLGGFAPGPGQTASPVSPAPQPSGTPVAGFVLPTWPTPIEHGLCPAAHMGRVTLRSDRTSSTAAIYVESFGGERRSILWPYGFSARFTPDLELLNERGEVVAREGDLMDLGGGAVAGLDPAYDFFACVVQRVE